MTKQGRWFSRLKDGLTRSSRSLSGGITNLLTGRKLDSEALEDLEDLLVGADLGVTTASRVTQVLSKSRFDKDISPDDVRKALADEVTEILTPVSRRLEIPRDKKPFVILVVGVNGSGKTTTIGKLAAQFTAKGRSVMLAAGDTFRAAAIEQLQIWGERAGATVISRDVGRDAASVAYEALEAAERAGTDILIIDTAGRLQNRRELMDELAKVVRVIRNRVPEAPHETLLVLDATTGQNVLSQVRVFKEISNVTGLIMTKLDGTAKGGILVACAAEFALPVYAIGVGEKIDDLRPFEASSFAAALVGLSDLMEVAGQ